MSVRSQCMNPMVFGMRRSEPSAKFPIPGPPALTADVDTIVSHVARFSLAGLHGVRKAPADSKTRRKSRSGAKKVSRNSLPTCGTAALGCENTQMGHVSRRRITAEGGCATSTQTRSESPTAERHTVRGRKAKR